MRQNDQLIQKLHPSWFYY